MTRRPVLPTRLPARRRPTPWAGAGARTAARFALGAAVLSAGCGRERTGGTPAATTLERAATAPALRGAWARPAAVDADGALYFTLANPGPDTLVLVGARANVAETTSLHETMRMGQGAGAMAHMAPLARLAVAPGDSAVFAPLGRHAMLERLRRPLAAGDSVPFALAVVRAGRPDTLCAVAVVRPF